MTVMTAMTVFYAPSLRTRIRRPLLSRCLLTPILTSRGVFLTRFSFRRSQSEIDGYLSEDCSGFETI